MKFIVVFCIAGNKFTEGFVKNWTLLLHLLSQNQHIEPHYIFYNDTDEFTLRNKILQYDEQNKKLFDGEWDYDYIVSIDSDITFEPTDIFKMLQKLLSNPKVKMICGSYEMTNGRQWAIKDFSEMMFAQGINRYFSTQELEKWSDDSQDNLLQVMNAGTKFFVAKKGLFEKIGYPFYRSDLEYNFNNEWNRMDPGMALGASFFKNFVLPYVDISVKSKIG